MTGIQWLFVTVIVVGWAFFYVRLKRYSKRKADDAGKTQEYERNRARSSAVVSLVMGSAFIAAMLFNWRLVPAGNEIFALAFIAFGIASILHGLYKLYGLRI